MAPGDGRRTLLSWGVLGALAVAAVHPGSACRRVEAPGPAASPELHALLRAVGPEVVLPTLARFTVEATHLRDAALAWRDAGDPALRPAAQGAFLAAMEVWQEAELHQIGPAGSSLVAVAGADLRDQIYSWPTTNPCRVDQELVEQGWDEPDFFTSNLVNAYGLAAIEHLLFAGEANACPGQVDPNADGAWDALGPEEIDARRAAFAVALADGVLARAAELTAAWSPDQGDFSGALDDGSVYADHQEALNAVTDALFYLESSTKDGKLALPLGSTPECAGEACADLVEGRESGGSAAWIAANLVGFRELFTGGEGAGIDDLLVSLDAGALADELLADLDAAAAAVDGLDGPLDEVIRADPEAVQAAHDAIKEVTDLVKGDLTTVLAVRVPREAAGDND